MDTLISNIFVPMHENLLFFHIRQLHFDVFTGDTSDLYTKQVLMVRKERGRINNINMEDLNFKGKSGELCQLTPHTIGKFDEYCEKWTVMINLCFW